MLMGLNRKMGLLKNKYGIVDELRSINSILKFKEKELELSARRKANRWDTKQNSPVSSIRNNQTLSPIFRPATTLERPKYAATHNLTTRTPTTLNSKTVDFPSSLRKDASQKLSQRTGRTNYDTLGEGG